MLWPVLLLSATGNTTLFSPVANRAGTIASVSATEAASTAAWVDPNPPVDVEEEDEAEVEGEAGAEDVSAVGSKESSVALKEGGLQ